MIGNRTVLFECDGPDVAAVRAELDMHECVDRVTSEPSGVRFVISAATLDDPHELQCVEEMIVRRLSHIRSTHGAPDHSRRETD